MFFLFLIFNYSVLHAQDTKTIELDSIEEKIFHQKYSSEPKEARISRIEEFLFGKKQQDESLDNRIEKITSSLYKNKPTSQASSQLTPEPLDFPSSQVQDSKLQAPSSDKKDGPKVLFDESSTFGIIGAISQIEQKVFNKTFNSSPFPARVNALEQKLLTKSEIIKNQQKPLLERVSVLVKKAGLPVNQKNNNVLQRVKPKIYTIDPQTNFLINDETHEIVKDSDGNPIQVKLPNTVLPQITRPFGIPQTNYSLQNPPYNYETNPYLPYGNPSQQQLPLDLFFNQGSEFGEVEQGY